MPRGHPLQTCTFFNIRMEGNYPIKSGPMSESSMMIGCKGYPSLCHDGMTRDISYFM